MEKAREIVRVAIETALHCRSPRTFTAVTSCGKKIHRRLLKKLLAAIKERTWKLKAHMAAAEKHETELSPTW